MNRTLITTCILCAAAIAISVIAALLQDSQGFLLFFVNTLFYISLPLIIIGGFLFLLERGVFNVTRYAFRKMFKVMQEKQASLIEEEAPRDDRELLYETHSFQMTYPFIITGLVLFALSMGLSFTILV